ncbi:MAG: hypothetical protein HeimC3_55080 [Candidatus Heimdallarchaeota archaeon LC_3]|nr:MAG: hypothetical protein HeimC3_55080 [Candidatus Heimdallarchaeota archaeon LC_3]
MKVLNLSNNKLKSIPKSFEHLQSLEIIDISKNHLIFFPKSLENLQNLQIIDLSRNLINNANEKIREIIFKRMESSSKNLSLSIIIYP